MEIIRPDIFTEELEVFPVDRHTNIKECIDMLKEGHLIVIEDYYSTGLQLLNALKSEFKNLNSKVFSSSRKARGNFRELSHRILLEVENHALIVRKSPQIPWLKILYPNENYFAISFPDIQALNSSWQWYEKGIEIPGLKHKIHPWYGVYFPTRFEHIELFYQWLMKYSGDKNLAYDIGSGSGILSMMLENQSFQKIYATDINPNAIVSIEESIQKDGYSKIKTQQGDLFAHLEEQADIVVFNPPWLPEKSGKSLLDAAIYYPEHLFDRFFQQAHQHLLAEGRLVLLFSNLQEMTHQSSHPIKYELENQNRFILDQLIEKSISKGSSKTKRNTSRRKKEKAELWILKKQ